MVIQAILVSVSAMLMASAVLAQADVSSAPAVMGSNIMFNLSDKIAQIKDEKSKTLRTQYSQQLSESIKKQQDELRDADIDLLASMLSDRDDSVRLWIATSIGYLGPRAKGTAPQLGQALREIACVHANLTSAPAIRLAFLRIGVEPPTVQCN